MRTNRRPSRTIAILLGGALLAIASAAALQTAAASDSPLFRELRLAGNAVRWHARSGAAGEIVVRWRLAQSTSRHAGADNCGIITPIDGLAATSGISMSAVRSELAAAFEMWSGVAGITFREAASETEADILVGAQGEPHGRAFAQVFFDASHSAAVKPITRSLICLNPETRWKVGYDGNLSIYDLRFTLAHEIGHAIGLDHPSGSGQLMWYRYEEKFRTLREGDIQGARLLYGARAGAVDAAARP